MYQECQSCPRTCSSPHATCTKECIPGCGCPPSQVVNEEVNKCTPLTECPSKFLFFFTHSKILNFFNLFFLMKKLDLVRCKWTVVLAWVASSGISIMQHLSNVKLSFGEDVWEMRISSHSVMTVKIAALVSSVVIVHYNTVEVETCLY